MSKKKDDAEEPQEEKILKDPKFPAWHQRNAEKPEVEEPVDPE